MTFVAFMMQVRANEIQREQLGKTFLMKDVESKIEERRAMELLKIDVDNAINDIIQRCKCIDEFCMKIKQNSLDEVPLMRPSVTSLTRYQSIDRNRVFNAFKAFVGDDGAALFQKTYSYLDFYYEAVIQINEDVNKEWEIRVEKRKKEIFSLFKTFTERIDEQIDHPFDTVIMDVLKDTKKDCKRVIINGEPDIESLWNLMISLSNSTKKELNCPEVYSLENTIEALKAENLSQSKALRDAADNFRDDDCLGVFNEISKRLDKALEEHREEEIRNKFEGKI